MKKKEKGNLILVQFAFGLLGGILAAVLTAIIGHWLMRTDLYQSLVYMIISGYVGMLLSIGILGYVFLKEGNHQHLFPRFFFQSLIGLLFSLLTLYVFCIQSVQDLPIAWINFLLFAFPLTASVLGFHIGLPTTKTNQ